MSDQKACRVLFVEDEAIVAMLIEDMLDDLGVQVVGPAAKIDHAMALAREAEVEAAVLDINLGGQSSYPVADVLRERGVPIIFATGYGPATLPEKFLGVPVLHKPFDRNRFADALRVALSDAPCTISPA